MRLDLVSVGFVLSNEGQCEDSVTLIDPYFMLVHMRFGRCGICAVYWRSV